MLGLALALALAAPAAQGGRLPPAPRELFRVLWQRDLAGKTLGEWKPVELGGVAVDPVTLMAVAGTRDGWLHAVRADGSRAWDFHGEGAFAGQPLVDGDTVYAGCNDGRLYAITLTTGKLRWLYETREQLATRPAILDGTVFIASLQDTVFAVDARTGAWKWHHHREPPDAFTIHGAASVAAVGGLVHAGFSDGTLVALDAATGILRWERHAAPEGKYPDVDSLVVDGGRVYATAYSGVVAALEADTGKGLWRYSTPEASRITVGGGTVVVVTTQQVIALSPGDGKALWTIPLEGSPAAPPMVVGKVVMVPSGEGGLHFLELASGRSVRVLNPGSGVSAAPGFTGRRAWVLSNEGRLFALEAL